MKWTMDLVFADDVDSLSEYIHIASKSTEALMDTIKGKLV
jgi:hypothetical protein